MRLWQFGIFLLHVQISDRLTIGAHRLLRSLFFEGVEFQTRKSRAARSGGSKGNAKSSLARYTVEGMFNLYHLYNFNKTGQKANNTHNDSH